MHDLNSPESTSERSVASLRVFHWALLVSPLIFAVVVGFLTGDGESPLGIAADLAWAPFVAGAVSIAAVPIAFSLRGRFYRRASETEDHEKAFSQFAAGSVLFAAILEAAAMLCLMLALVQGGMTPTGWFALIPAAAMLAGVPSDDVYAGLRRIR